MPQKMARRAVSSDRRARPPAKRRGVRGLARRRMAIESRMRASSRKGRSPSGVPGMGWRMLTGIDAGAISASAKASSMSCSSVSPMPMMPPQQISRPRRFAARSVSSFCSCVCVEQSAGKSDGAVSRLQWTRSRPASLRRRKSSADKSPSEPQRWMRVRAFIARRASQRSSMLDGVWARPLVTMPMRPTPFASASAAAWTQASVPIQPWFSHPVFQWALWAHHLQFSEQRPARAFTMPQKSKRFGAKAAVTRSATAYSSSRGACRRRSSSSPAVAGAPPEINRSASKDGVMVERG